MPATRWRTRPKLFLGGGHLFLLEVELFFDETAVFRQVAAAVSQGERVLQFRQGVPKKYFAGFQREPGTVEGVDFLHRPGVVRVGCENGVRVGIQVAEDIRGAVIEFKAPGKPPGRIFFPGMFVRRGIFEGFDILRQLFFRLPVPAAVEGGIDRVQVPPGRRNSVNTTAHCRPRKRKFHHH